jgi:hypothetical protein
MDKNNFFAKVNVPTFDSNYASSFEQFVETINNNFTRIASLPFLKGDNGSSIIIHKEKLYDENNKFTTFGILFVKAIYKELAGKTFGNFDELKNVLKTVYPNSEPVSGVYSCEQLNPKKTTYIPVYHDQYTGEKHLCVPYIFQDSRKTVLQGNYLSTYVDQTKYVIGDSHKKEEGVFSWRFETSDFIPSLYYDEDNSMYCWSINGEKSGITAQGVKGEDGNSSKAWLCKGEISDNYDDYIEITEVFSSSYDSVKQSVEESGIVEGDLAVVTFSNSEEENDILFGPVIIATGVQVDYLVKISGNNLLSIKNHNDFHALMKSTGASIQNPESGLNDVLGLYTFGRTKELQTQANGGSPRKPHMFWVDEEETTAHIAPVTVDDDSNNPKRESITGEFEIKLDYKNVTAQENVNAQNLHASKNVFIGDNSVIKEEQEDKIPSNINVTDNLTCVLVPSTNITQVEFGGNLIQDNNEATPESVMITMDLPSLGIKTPNGDIICFDKAESLEGGSKINIGLKLEELNCNWNENDNTSWGGRSYFDVDLYASSATFNSNEEQSVYVGSKELPIKTNINGTEYFAKLQVSAIRYDVAFNEDNNPLFVRGFYNAEPKFEMVGETNKTILTTDLVRTAGSLRDAVKQFKNTRESASIGEITIGDSGNTIMYNNDSIDIMNWQFSVNDIKTITDIIIYIKPYNNNNTDLFRLIYDSSFYGETPDFLQGVFDIKDFKWVDNYYTCTRYRFINNKISSYNEPSQNGDSNYEVFDINTLNTLSSTTGSVISDVIFEERPNGQGLVKINSPEYLKGNFNIIDPDTINVGSKDYTITIGNGNVVSTMKSNFEIKTTSGTATDNYIILKKSVGFPNMKFVIYEENAPSPASIVKILAKKDTQDSFDIKCDDIIIKDCKVKTYNNTLYLEVKFSSDAVDGGKLVATVVSAKSPMGTNNTKYRKILNSNYNNTIDIKLLNSKNPGFETIIEKKNIYSPKFNDYSWNIGRSIYKYDDSTIYRSGIGCGKILPFPKQQGGLQNTVSNQHSIIPNSNWYLSLPAKKLSMSELGLNDYLSITPNGRINLTLSNNCVVTNLPQDKKCYHCEFWNIGKNKQVVTSNISNVSFIDEISGDPEEPVTNLDKPVLNSVDFIVTPGTGLTGVKLSWTQIENADSYNIQANLSSGLTKKITGFNLEQNGITITANLDENILKKNNISILNLTGATFQVQATKGSVTSEWSEPVQPTSPTN